MNDGGVHRLRVMLFGGAVGGAVGGVVGGGHRLEGRLWCVWGLAVGFRYGFRRAQVQAARVGSPSPASG